MTVGGGALRAAEVLPFSCAAVWGKARGLTGMYPLEAHLLDAAACASWLVERVLSGSQRAALADGLGVDRARVGAVAGLVAGWHDLGKLVPSFQGLAPEAAAGLTGAPLVVGEADRVA